MKKFLKSIALLLTAALVVGTANIPASAAATVKVKNPSKAIYVGGCTGTKANGTAAKNKSYLKVTSLLTGYDSSTMLVKLSTSDKSIASVNNKKLRVYAKGIGTAEITVKVYKGKKAKAANLITEAAFDVTVKKNATTETISYSGIKDGSTYKVGEKVTVTVPKAKGKDNDYRRLVAKSDNVKVTKSGSNWIVEFTKAGAFELAAEAYMSSTYKGTTASKSIKGTVGETVAPAKLEAKQTSLTTIVLSGLTSEVKKENISMYTMPAGVKDTLINNYISDVKYDKETGSATVTMYDYSSLTAGTVYYFDVAESTASFTAIAGGLKNVASFKLKNTVASLNEATVLKFLYFNAQGIDITDSVESDPAFNSSSLRITLKTTDDPSAYLPSGSNELYMYKDGGKAQFEFVLVKGLDSSYNEVTLTATGILTAKAATFTGTAIYTITEDDGTYLKQTDKVSHEIMIGDTAYLEALLLYSDEKYHKLSEIEYDVISSSNDNVLMVGGTAGSAGGIVLYPGETAGTATITVRNKSSVVASFVVTVKAARKITSFTVEVANNKRNLNAGYDDDEVVLKAIAKDQYGDVVKEGASFSIVQTDATIASTGTVSGLSFNSNGTCTLYGGNVALTGSGAYVSFRITCDNIENSKTETVNIYVKNVATPIDGSHWTPANTSMVVDGATTIDTTLKIGTQENKETSVTAAFSINGYCVAEGIGKLLTRNPREYTPTTLSAADSQSSQNVPALYCTIMHNGTYINPTSANYSSHITMNTDSVGFKPLASGSKLPKGTYTITVWKVVPGASNLTVTQLKQQVITVTDGDPETKYEVLSSNFSGTLPGALSQCFKLYVDGTDVTDKITDCEKTGPGSQNQYNIINITVGGLNNSVYGSFSVRIKIGRTVISR